MSSLSSKGRRLAVRRTLARYGIWERLPLVLLPMSGGLSLVVHILTGRSFALTILIFLTIGLAIWAFIVATQTEAVRRQLISRIKVGLVAGATATLAYDVTRYCLVSILSLSFAPFHTWTLFGQALVGVDANARLSFALGMTYHVANGIGFATAFAIVIRRPTWKLGVLWALVLELAMALLYPTWMVIRQLDEFLSVSILGHIVYGFTLGAIARRLTSQD
jgi:hypothetical protein